MGKRISTLATASSPANDDYLPIDGATNGTRKLSASFFDNIIEDVTVDGTSVVDDGVAEIDLSGKQDTLTAGSNIQIAQDGTISATDTTYTAGTNVQIDNGVISATDTTYIAGTNVQINNNVISATDTTYTAGTGIDITNGVISSDVTPGSTVTITPALATGTKVADYSIDGTTGSLYAPNDGGSTVSVTQKTSTGTNIADITVDGVTTQLYAPNGGGGGGSDVTITPTLSSGTKIADYEIDGVSGELYAPDPGSPTRRYLGELIPRVSGTDSHISASTEGSYGSTTWYAWGAFSNSTISDWSVPESGSSWVDASENNPTIQYHFDNPRYFTQLAIDCGSNYDSSYTGTIYIEASNDGTTWTDIGSGAQTINAPYRSISTNTYALDDTDTWEYIRIRGAQSFFIRSNPSCFMQRIQAYGGDIINGIDASTIDFSTLTATQISQLQTLLGIN